MDSSGTGWIGNNMGKGGGNGSFILSLGRVDLNEYSVGRMSVLGV